MDWGKLENDFGAMHAKYEPFVRRLLSKRGVRKADLDDVVQEVFVTLHRQLPSFEGRSSLETWLHAVTWRIAAAHQRRASVRYELPSEQAEQDVATASGARRVDAHLHATLGQLEAEQRDVIALHDVAGFSISEVAELTGRARATIRERLERARTALGRRLWRSLTSEGDPLWLDRLAPELAARLAQRERSKVHHKITERAAISRLDDIVIIVWRGQSSVPELEVMIEMMLDAIDDYPDGIRHMTIIERTSTPPARQGRELISWAAGKCGPKLRAAAHVIEDSGMMSMAAALINACFFVGGSPLNLRFFDGVPSSAEWTAQYGTHTPLEIEAHIERMRRELDAQRA